MNVLGLNFFHPNAAAAVFVDGRLVAAAEEERFNRVKFSAGIPLEAIRFCLESANLKPEEVDVVAFPRSPTTRVVNPEQIHFQDRIYPVTSHYDRYRIDLRVVNFRQLLAHGFGLDAGKLQFRFLEQDHHLSHMLSGFHYCPFDRALLISCDGFGDYVSLRTGIGRGDHITLLRKVEFPHSLGLFYTMITQFLGFHAYGDEAKVMGLSTFGCPEHTDRLRQIVSYQDGCPRLNLRYFGHQNGVGTAWFGEVPDIAHLGNGALQSLLGPARDSQEEITERHQNIAASLQHLVEEILFSMIEEMVDEHGMSNLVLTGGLASNSLLNGRILEETPIERIYVPPAPGNGGLCLGAALAFLATSASREEMNHAFFGPSYSSREISHGLNALGVQFQDLQDPVSAAVDLLAAGKTLGWFQGRMEFGPRSLGGRSILINPLSPDLHSVKNRDYLKPFGVSILEREACEYFQKPHPSPFMSFMGKTRHRHRKEFESVLLNNHCRYQTVGPEAGIFCDLLTAFRERTGLPFLINTSLNPQGQPIVESPAMLVEYFQQMSLDAAILDRLLISSPADLPRAQP